MVQKLPVRALIIEDDDVIAALLTQMLTRDGYFVTRARDGDEGISAYERERPQVCLVDGLLPKKNGFEVCKHIRAAAGDKVGLILMSAAFRNTKPETFREAGVDAFLTKPFVFSDLRRRVAELAQRTNQLTGGVAAVEDEPKQQQQQQQQQREKKAPAFPTGAFDSSQTVAMALLTASRAGASGIIKITAEGSVLELAILRGVIVGARDNLRENRLGESLLGKKKITHDDMKRVNERVAKGERIAEALVALGLCDAYEALDAINSQVRERLARALAWPRGVLAINTDEADAHRLGVATHDLQREILAFALDDARDAAAHAFVYSRGGDAIARTVDFDEGLRSYATMRPESTLPAALLAGARTMGDAAKAAPGASRDLYALWLAGLIRFFDDPEDPRPVARLVESADTGFVDAKAASRVASALLKMRGRSLYGILGLDRTSSKDAIEARLAEIEKDVGVTALGTASLGPARAAARELWALIEEARATLLDDSARAIHDLSLAPQSSTRLVVAAFTPEQEYLDGQIALALGDARAACAAFAKAARARPNDPDVTAYLAWASVLNGEDEAFARDMLETAARAFPQAMRPELVLGLLAGRRGDRTTAEAHLREAVSRSPTDVEARKALADLLAG